MRKYGRFAFMIFTWIIDFAWCKPPRRFDVTFRLISLHVSSRAEHDTASVYSREILRALARAFRKVYSSFLRRDIIFPLHLTQDTRIIRERYTWSSKKYE